MNTNDTFLNKYTKLENIIRDKCGCSVLEYETALEEKKDPRFASLRFCRQCRNFLVHENKAFFTISDKMIRFLDEFVDKLDRSQSAVTKKMHKTFFTPKSKVDDVFSFMLKANIFKPIPIFDGEKVISELTMTKIVAFVKDNKVTKTTKIESMCTPAKKTSFLSCDVHTPLSDIGYDHVTYLVKDGETIVGWI